MTTHEVLSLSPVTLADIPNVTERAIVDRLCDSPKAIGIGRCLLLSREYPISPDGRVDLVFESVDGSARYVVEVQRGLFNDDHMIRLCDYASLAVRHHPHQSIHAVAVAEEFSKRAHRFGLSMTGGFSIRLHRLLVQRCDSSFYWLCVPVFDSRCFDSLVAPPSPPPADLAERCKARCHPDTVACLSWFEAEIKRLDPNLDLNYCATYVGVSRSGSPANFVILRPRYSCLVVEIRLPKTDCGDKTARSFGTHYVGYDDRQGRYRLRLHSRDIQDNGDDLSFLLREAYRADPAYTRWS